MQPAYVEPGELGPVAGYVVSEHVDYEDGTSGVEEHDLPGIPPARCRWCWAPLAEHGRFAECP